MPVRKNKLKAKNDSGKDQNGLALRKRGAWICGACDGDACKDSKRECYNQRATMEGWLPSRLNSLSKHVPSRICLDLDDTFRHRPY